MILSSPFFATTFPISSGQASITYGACLRSEVAASLKAPRNDAAASFCKQGVKYQKHKIVNVHGPSRARGYVSPRCPTTVKLRPLSGQE
jgi:hypothetical protein